MDLAVRASLRGWKFVYLGDLQVLFIAPTNYSILQKNKQNKNSTNALLNTHCKCIFSRPKVNFQVLSMHSDSNSTGGHVALQISSGKWSWKSSETRSITAPHSTTFFSPRQRFLMASYFYFYFFFRLQKVRFWKKVYVIYSFFFVRKIIAHMVTFIFYCVVLPLTILVPEVHVPIWGAVYIPSIITILNSVGTPRSVICYNYMFQFFRRLFL